MKTIEETTIIPDEFVDRFLEVFLMDMHFPGLVESIPQERLWRLIAIPPSPGSHPLDGEKVVDEVQNIRMGGTYTKTGLPILRLFTI